VNGHKDAYNFPPIDGRTTPFGKSITKELSIACGSLEDVNNYGNILLLLF
jgi:hypothetical protein